MDCESVISKTEHLSRRLFDLYATGFLCLSYTTVYSNCSVWFLVSYFVFAFNLRATQQIKNEQLNLNEWSTSTSSWNQAKLWFNVKQFVNAQCEPIFMLCVKNQFN